MIDLDLFADCLDKKLQELYNPIVSIINNEEKCKRLLEKPISRNQVYECYFHSHKDTLKSSKPLYGIQKQWNESIQHKASLCYEDFKYISHQKYKKLLKLNTIICALYNFLHWTKVMSLFS